MGKVVKMQGSGDIGLPPLYVPSKKEFKDAVILNLETKQGGTLRKIPKGFLNKQVWIKIEDEDMFVKLFPTHEHYVLRDFELYGVFVSKESPRFKNVSELVEQSKALVTKYENELIMYITKEKKKEILQNAEDFINSLNFYQLEAFVSEMVKAKSIGNKNVKKDNN